MIEMTTNNNVLSNALTSLLCHNSFYARIISALSYSENDKVPTAAVSIDKSTKKYKFLYNKNFIESLNAEALEIVCEHETLHIVLNHIPRTIMLLNGKEPTHDDWRLSNIAADFAANSYIINKHNKDVIKEMKLLDPSDPQFNLPLGETFEFYFNEVKKNQEKYKDIGSTHYIDLSELTPDQIQDVCDRLAENGIKIVKQFRNAGNVPDCLRNIIDDFIAGEKVPWNKILRNVCMAQIRSKIKRTVSRPSRRLFGNDSLIPFPGKKKDPRLTILYAIDTSGSMGIEELKCALAELLSIVKSTKSRVVVCECDCVVHSIYEVDNVDDIKAELHGGGGTDVNPVFKKIKDKEIVADVIVYCTDGYIVPFDDNNRVKKPVIWLLTKGGQIPVEGYGHVIHME